MSANHPPGNVVTILVIAKEAVKKPNYVPVAPNFLAYKGRRGMTKPKPNMLTNTAKHNGKSCLYIASSFKSFLNV